VAGAALADDTVQRLHDRTGGNPLFIVETVRTLLEDDALVKRGGRLELVDAASLRRVPVNLRALLGARIDALPVPARAALQVASVIGMTFSPGLVAQLLGVPAADERLATLVEAGIVDPAEPGADWRFRHPLIRDVGYAGMLSSRRRELHARLADSLEARPVPPPIGQLAHHRAASGDRERAVPLLAQAAEAALLVGATSEAADHWRMAAALLGDDPAGEEFRARIRGLEPSVAIVATADEDRAG
jgi:predicted ATPase